MKNGKSISIILLAVLIFFGSYSESYSQNRSEINESNVRYKIADMQLGDVYNFYERQRNSDNDTNEAVRRWEAGIRVTNLHKFQRKEIGSKGWRVVHRGTVFTVNGIDIELTSDKKDFSESNVRYKLIDMQLGKVYGFYKSLENSDPDTREAVKRWEEGVRVINLYSFERKNFNNKGWRVVHKGTNNTINGIDVKLTTDR